MAYEYQKASALVDVVETRLSEAATLATALRVALLRGETEGFWRLALAVAASLTIAGRSLTTAENLMLNQQELIQASAMRQLAQIPEGELPN